MLVLGKEGGTVLRQIGRWYGRLTRLKTELLGEFAKAADLPAPVPGQVVSIRQSILNWEPGTNRTIGVPIAVTTPPAIAEPAFAAPVGSGLQAPTWSISSPHAPQEPVRTP